MHRSQRSFYLRRRHFSICTGTKSEETLSSLSPNERYIHCRNYSSIIARCVEKRGATFARYCRNYFFDVERERNVAATGGEGKNWRGEFSRIVNERYAARGLCCISATAIFITAITPSERYLEINLHFLVCTASSFFRRGILYYIKTLDVDKCSYPCRKMIFMHTLMKCGIWCFEKVFDEDDLAMDWLEQIYAVVLRCCWPETKNIASHFKDYETSIWINLLFTNFRTLWLLSICMCTKNVWAC